MIIVAINKVNQKIYESQSCVTENQIQVVTENILADAVRDNIEVEIQEMATDRDVEQYILGHLQYTVDLNCAARKLPSAWEFTALRGGIFMPKGGDTTCSTHGYSIANP